MNTCLQCKKETKNPKFCDKSCSAKFNNRFRKKDFGICPICRNKLETKLSTYCSLKCSQVARKRQYINRWKDGKESGTTKGKYPNISSYVRNYLLELSNYRCSDCRWGGVSKFTGKVPLEIHHIDGDWKNNRPENLKVLCPNCHSLTSTYGSLNMASKGVYKRQSNNKRISK